MAHMRCASRLIFLVAVTVGCGGQMPTATPQETVAVADLPSIVVSPDTAPPGMTLSTATGEAADVLTRPVLPRSGVDLDQFRRQAEFVGGYYAEFSCCLLSWVALFRSPAGATSSFALYRSELASPEAYGLTLAAEPDLGDEGVCGEGDVLLPGGVAHEGICLWRTGSLVLAAGGTLPLPEVKLIAKAMAAKVP
jgi:hypothetical protein